MMELTYTQRGDYLIPNLSVPKRPQIGRFGRLRQTYLKTHRTPEYNILLLKGKLIEHLEQTDREAKTMKQRIVAQMAKSQGVTEYLKATNQMEWVGKMNQISQAADEQILQDLIYA